DRARVWRGRATATRMRSKIPRPRRTMSRWPRVTGSKVPGKMARSTKPLPTPGPGPRRPPRLTGGAGTGKGRANGLEERHERIAVAPAIDELEAKIGELHPAVVLDHQFPAGRHPAGA